MRVVLVSDWFSEKMGYIENCLPRALSSLGVDVDLVTSDGRPYFTSDFYSDVYEPFLGPPTVPPGMSAEDGFVVHRSQHFSVRGRLGIKNLSQLLTRLRPDVVQALDHPSLTAVQAAAASLRLRVPLFTANHVHASVFPPAQAERMGLPTRAKLKLFSWSPGRFVSLASTRCYAISPDAAETAIRFFGMQPAKVTILPLGVDTDLFRPTESDADKTERQRQRAALGIDPEDTLCIYTGRLSDGKNPLCLARALQSLTARGERFKALFVGGGPQAKSIEETPGCLVLPFVPFQELPGLFRAADIGVWPRQESTSILDASACGLPVVISDLVTASERFEGNGLGYRQDDPDSLSEALLRLQDPETRARMGRAGVSKIRSHFSWRANAATRLADYVAELDRRGIKKSNGSARGA